MSPTLCLSVDVYVYACIGWLSSCPSHSTVRTRTHTVSNHTSQPSLLQVIWSGLSHSLAYASQRVKRQQR